ncbi:hypothetical protein ACSL9C_001444 [Vibrio navarrensis]
MMIYLSDVVRKVILFTLLMLFTFVISAKSTKNENKILPYWEYPIYLITNDEEIPSNIHSEKINITTEYCIWSVYPYGEPYGYYKERVLVYPLQKPMEVGDYEKLNLVIGRLSAEVDINEFNDAFLGSTSTMADYLDSLNWIADGDYALNDLVYDQIIVSADRDYVRISYTVEVEELYQQIEETYPIAGLVSIEHNEVHTYVGDNIRGKWAFDVESQKYDIFVNNDHPFQCTEAL